MKTLQIEEFNTSVEGFRSYLNAKNYSNRESYIYCVVEMLEWMEKKGIGTIKSIHRSLLLDYFHYLMGRPSKLGGYLSESHLKNNAYAVELFFDMLLQNGIVERGVRVPRKIMKGKKSERQTVTLEELKTIYDATESPIERAIISLAYGCGLRRSEITMLDLDDMRFKTSELFVREGKGRKFRTVLMNENVIEDLQNYIKSQRFDLLKKRKSYEKALLINKVGKRMSGDSLNAKLKAVITRVGDPILQEKNITLHCLRHSVATHFVEKGVGMEFIQRFLGHSELDTSQLYAMKRQSMQKYKS